MISDFIRMTLVSQSCGDGFIASVHSLYLLVIVFVWTLGDMHFETDSLSIHCTSFLSYHCLPFILSVCSWNECKDLLQCGARDYVLCRNFVIIFKTLRIDCTCLVNEELRQNSR